ncbi:non-ribosomal peptide synthetase [Serratia ficaria]|uniref:Dimodular nonribosomal peptide synthase n=1 Tax=Serratia ficaria TaxID=61651 RepID=A0A240BV47_SERFI|nr:non-ribosomal peptide synthetase [Serratia ficaria]REF45376.1 amino acid adenylation domain-containing protein [Serratia ficaria]CAI0888527.1 Dimodular nonribosomal peptide synthase [Serratia ficaria]CAI0892724.1 Dimodular nonribosomal peptide synthase [Serratia ficaria]CAI0940314.1 Dimodular nonribosomal peptide synthase [Serratia ficaria]CAI2016214.1 Dimodular nonribosomal peptide synthase [Serratia ficaria]
MSEALVTPALAAGYHELPLVAAQPGIWLAEQIADRRNIFAVAHYIELQGDIDPARLDVAVRHGLAEADTLHATFLQGEQGPLQRIPQRCTPAQVQPLELLDFSGRQDGRAAALALMQADLAAELPADGDAPLYRQLLARVPAADGGATPCWFWFQRFHHLTIDGFSFAALTRRIVDIYRALTLGKPIGDSPFTPFAAVVEEYQRYRQSEAARRDAAFWQQHCAALPAAVSLASGGEADAGDLRVRRYRASLDAAGVEGLLAIAQGAQVAVPETLMAALAVYLYRMSGESHLSIGCPFMRRMGSAALNALGPVVNILPLQLQLGDEQRLADVAQALAAEIKRARKHQRYEAEQLRRDLGLVGQQRELYGPVFNFKMFDYALDLGGVTGSTHALATGPVDDLEFEIYLQQGELTIELAANPSRYDDASLRLHGERLLFLLRQLIARPETPLGALALAADAELAMMEQWAKGPALAMPAGAVSVLDIFRQRVMAQPQDIAVACGDAQLSYQALAGRVAQLARELIARGVGAEDVVAIGIPRSVDSLVAILGVLASGAAYMPLDLDYPRDRLTLMCDDARPRLLLAHAATQAQLPPLPEILLLDDADFLAACARHSAWPVSDAERRMPLHGAHLAYMIYTSGSTGRPKGVMSTHQGLLNLLHAHASHLYGPAMAEFQRHNTRRMRAGHTASFSFDSSWEPLFWMMIGCELYIFDEELRRDAYALVQTMDRIPIDAMDITPSFFTQMIDGGLLEAGRHRPAFIMIGGEAATPRLWNLLRQHPELNVHNYYGPSEYTIDTLGASARVAEQPVIGRPVANTEVYLLDGQLRQVPVGVVGELYIAGAGLARGYLRRPDLTAARFVANPFRPGGVMYRSGDLMRWRCDGQLDFVGRTDHQIKVRGFRVELGEVENALVALPQVSTAVAIAEAIGATHRLIGYCSVPDAALRANPALSSNLLEQLALSLPDYMVPAVLVVLDELPLTVNGKIDRRALPAPERPVQQASRAPQTPQEILICRAMAGLLGLARVGADDDFFTLGGDSISAMGLGTLLRREGYQLRPKEVFSQRTPARMALALQALAQTRRPAAALRLPDAVLKRARDKYGAMHAVLPVLPLQQGLLFHAQLGSQANNYNAISRFDLEGPLDAARLRDTLAQLLVRYPQLAAIFDSDLHDEPLQVLPQPGAAAWPWRTLDLSAMAEPQQREALGRLEKELLAQDLMAASPQPLLSAVLLRLGEQRHTLLIAAHHLVGDGWSSAILLHDLLHLYGGETLPALKVDYAALIGEMAQRDRNAQRDAWRERLLGVVPTLLYPDADIAGEVHELEVSIPARLEQALKALLREQGITLSTLLQGVWATLLGALAGRDDVVFGTPVSGRYSEISGIEQHVGLFSNTLPVRFRLQPERPLLAQLQAQQQQQIPMLEHDGLGLGEIQRLAGSGTLFDTMLVVENYPEDEGLHQRRFQGLRCPAMDNHGYTHYPLTLLALPGERLRLQLEYRAAVGDARPLAQRLLTILTALVENPAQPLAAMDLRTPEEMALQQRVNATQMALPAETLCDALARQAEATPQATALADIHGELTYRQVRQRVNALAAQLQLQGVRPGDRVAVALPRSAELSLALMAILQAGAAYLPLDTGYPDQRLAYMLQDAQPRLLITESRQAERFNDLAPLLLTDEPLPEASFRPVRITRQHPAYLIYTSGSTGRPKGVVVSHGAIVNRLRWMQAQYPLTPADVVLQKTPCSFDVSVWEFFWPLMVGARLFMAPPEAHREPETLRGLIESRGVTTLHFVPSMLAAFVASLDQRRGACPTLRQVFCSGEALQRELCESWQRLSAAPLHNLYGPTEAAVDVSYQPAFGASLAQVSGVSVPIGKPVWNTQLIILDHLLRPVPLGVAGELYLGGVQLAQGYHARPDLNAARFVANPLHAGQRMYRTGDVARWLPDGTVEYLGRSDDQLKIRGQRIELGEIEAALLELPQVGQAVVHARLPGEGKGRMAGADERQLVGYVIPTSGARLDVDALRAQLASRLPAHMVPVALVAMDAFPLSANGKLDRKALPAPTGKTGQGRAPAAGLERQIAALFCRLLGVERVDAEDDFFALGGHSLLAMRLAAELKRELMRPVAVGQVMVASSVAALAAALASEAAADGVGFDEALPLRAGEGRPLFCVHPASGFAWQFSLLPRYLPGQIPIVGLQSPRPHGAIAANRDMDALCEQHLATLRRLQPSGPYHLMGYSLGGTVAQAIAVKLREQGEEVAFLGLLDTYPPETQDWHAPISAEALEEVERERALFMASAGDDEAEKRAMFDQIQANYDDSVGLLSAAKTPRYDGKITLFAASQTLDADPQAVWAPYVSQLETHVLDCSHITMMSPETMTVLGPLLRRILAGCDALGR